MRARCLSPVTGLPVVRALPGQGRTQHIGRRTYVKRCERHSIFFYEPVCLSSVQEVARLIKQAMSVLAVGAVACLGFTVPTQAQGGENVDAGSTFEWEDVAREAGAAMLSLLPAGLVSQVHVPGMDVMVGKMRSQIMVANPHLQQHSGMCHDQAARLAAKLGARMVGPEGRALAGAAMAGAGLLATGYVVPSCTNREAGTSSVGLALI